MADVVVSFRLLFDRPYEPMIVPKGDKGIVFELTEDHLAQDYEVTGLELNKRFGDKVKNKIQLKPLRSQPQFPTASQLPKDADFSLFLPRHQEMATEVIDNFMSFPQDQLNNFLSMCAYARENLNPQLFNYCYSVALMHRRDTRNIAIPNFAEIFPSKFLDSPVFIQARQYAAIVPKDAPRYAIITPPVTSSNLDEEHRVAYWREDIGINLYYWRWHIAYPFTTSYTDIVAKDRRGELFFYMNQQIIARYNCERLNNAMKKVKKFGNWKEQIPEAYYPKLDSRTSSRSWPPRQAHMSWQDLNRPADGLNVTMADMERWRRNIEEAISTGRVTMPDGSKQELDIDMLGNMVEASILSPNRELYGSINTFGHLFSGYIHDPTDRYLEKFAVMGDNSITMRDPFFYRWHAWIDDIFQKHKESSYVPSYTASELENPGVQVTSATVESKEGLSNVLNTFWMSSDIDISQGLDFSNRGAVYIRLKHLNHKPFRYVIKVNNTGAARLTTVRIFMCPKYDEREELPWPRSEHRKMFIEMDRFVTPLTAGHNTITRKSTESSCTIPFEQTFRNCSQADDPKYTDPSPSKFCDCGWPQHVLVPRGTETGAPYVMFVMLSDYEADKVEQPDVDELSCKEASSYCGLRGRKYPDRRAMGFPFDRSWPRGVATIQHFISGRPNMSLTDITIKLSNITVPNPCNPST